MSFTNTLRTPKTRAKYESSQCARCGHPIHQGQWVEKWKGENFKKLRWVHVGCELASKHDHDALPQPQVKEIGLDEIKLLVEEVLGETVTSVIAEAESKIDTQNVQSEMRKSLQKWIDDREPRKLVIEHVHKPKKPESKTTSHKHVKFERVLKLAAARKHIFLPGPAGCGKSYLAHQIADELDLDYAEDSSAAVDANFVLTHDGRIIEIQGSGEEAPFGEGDFQAMFALAKQGVGRLAELQRQALGLE